MADNVVLDPGAGGDTIAADDVAGVKYQVVKLDVGGDGAAAPLSNSNPVPVSDAGGVLSVDDAAGSLTVDNAALSVVGGGVEATALRVTLASDSTGLVSVDDNGSTLSVDDGGASLTVDGTVAVSGSVAVTNAALSVVGGGLESTAQRVTIASDSTGLLSVDDNGGSLTVDGTVSITANSSVNLNQVAGTGAATGNGTASAGCQRVTVASDNTAFSVNAVQSGTWTVQPGNTANTTAWLVQDVAGTTGGASFNGFVGAASNNKTQIKGSAGTLYSVSVQNLAATPVYLKVFDKTSANVTAGTTACDYQFLVPGNTAGAGIVFDSAKGIAHANGITVMLTAGIATTDNTSVSANQQVATIAYK